MTRTLLRCSVAVLFALTLFSSRLTAGGDHWPIDRAHSRVTFGVTKWGFADVEGRFHDFTGAISYNAARPEASHIEWKIRIATVDTGEVKRDEALQAREYFDAARYPEITFTSNSVKRAGANELDVTGSLSMKGITKPLTVRVTYGGRHTVPMEGTYDTFKTSFTINRYDFGIVGGTVMGSAISKDVKINLVAAAKQPAR
jgi:polyisoprenoid-binding protein YceI